MRVTLFTLTQQVPLDFQNSCHYLYKITYEYFYIYTPNSLYHAVISGNKASALAARIPIDSASTDDVHWSKTDLFRRTRRGINQRRRKLYQAFHLTPRNGVSTIPGHPVTWSVSLIITHYVEEVPCILRVWPSFWVTWILRFRSLTVWIWNCRLTTTTILLPLQTLQY